MNDWLVPLHPSVWMAVMTGVLVILLGIVIALWVKLAKLRAAYKNMMNGTGASNLEQMLLELKEEAGRVWTKVESHSSRLGAIETAMKTMKCRVGVNRYNAFGEGGPDLSFSIAILSDTQDGVVLTGIHNRDDMFIYAKPIEGGQSRYVLTPEEKEAISRCSESAPQ